MIILILTIGYLFIIFREQALLDLADLDGALARLNR